jgi:hypothetical protein
MSVELSKELWNDLKRYINVVDRTDAAQSFVEVLIDNDVDVDDIKSAFKTDTDIKRALTSYLKDHPADDDEEDEDEGYIDDEWDDEGDDY